MYTGIGHYNELELCYRLNDNYLWSIQFEIDALLASLLFFFFSYLPSSTNCNSEFLNLLAVFMKSSVEEKIKINANLWVSLNHTVFVYSQHDKLTQMCQSAIH